jgi:hypothetical protein
VKQRRIVPALSNNGLNTHSTYECCSASDTLGRGTIKFVLPHSRKGKRRHKSEVRGPRSLACRISEASRCWIHNLRQSTSLLYLVSTLAQAAMSLAAARSLSLSRPLSQFVVPPHRVAHALDWNKDTGRLLSLSISREKIGLAVAPHPRNSWEVQELSPIRIGTERRSAKMRTLLKGVAEELSSIVNEWTVCGMVVHWPVQRDGGWCGAPCGRVLFTLDQLAKSNVLSNRPICLWDDEDCKPSEDSWGRSRIYARGTKTKTFHIASQEQYKPRSVILSEFWHDFRRFHWPEQNVQFIRSTQRHASGCRKHSSRKADVMHGPWLVSEVPVYRKPTAAL